jgi:hypothetical protein
MNVARSLRLELASALYHRTGRGNDRQSIRLGDADTDRQ